MADSAPAPIADRSPFRQLLQPVAITVAFLLLALLLRSQWGALAALDWHIQPRYLVVSGACIVGGWLVEVALWRRLVTIVGGRLGYIRAVQLWFAGAIGGHIPANVWL